jgi:hypothetical protein
MDGYGPHGYARSKNVARVKIVSHADAMSTRPTERKPMKPRGLHVEGKKANLYLVASSPHGPMQVAVSNDT